MHAPKPGARRKLGLALVVEHLRARQRPRLPAVPQETDRSRVVACHPEAEHDTRHKDGRAAGVADPALEGRRVAMMRAFEIDFEGTDATRAREELVRCKVGERVARLRLWTGAWKRAGAEPNRAEANPPGVRQHRGRSGHRRGV